MDDNKTIRVLPPQEMFEQTETKVSRHTIQDGQLMTPTYRVELPEEGGVLSWHVGDKFPHKAWPFKEAVFAVDSIKRAITNLLYFLVSSPIRYVAVFFIVLPRKIKRKIVDNFIIQFVGFAHVVFRDWGTILQFSDEQENVFGLTSVRIKSQFYCDMAREIYRVGMKMAGDNKYYQELVTIVCMFFEYDDAYRYRIQDLFGLVDKQKMLQNPRKEFVYLLQEALKRDTSKDKQGVPKKINMFLKLIPILFLIRDFKKLVKEFFEEVDLDKVILDHTDFYRVLLWGGWNWAGMPDEERISLRMMIDADWVHGVNEDVKQKNVKTKIAS